MPKVHQDQSAKFEEEFFTKFHQDTEVKYTMLPKTIDASDKLIQLKKDMQEGSCHLAFKSCGTNLPVRFPMNEGDDLPAKEWADFDKEPGKVHLCSRMVLNGVCCRLIAVLDLDSYEGLGHLEYDDELAKREAQMAQDIVDILPRRVPAFRPQGEAPATPNIWDQSQIP